MVTIMRICFCTAWEACVILWTSGLLVIGDQMNLSSRTPRIELVLRPHQVLNLDNRQRQMAIECKNGLIWVTSDGEHRDHILQAGRTYIPRAKGNVVIEALDEACVDIAED